MRILSRISFNFKGAYPFNNIPSRIVSVNNIQSSQIQQKKYIVKKPFIMIVQINGFKIVPIE
jgi:hypothetical protein